MNEMSTRPMFSDRRRREWFAQLASLVYPVLPGTASDAFKGYLPMLRDLPDGAFTTESLEAVVKSPRKMAIPAYDEVAKPLESWWRANRPFVTALPAPQFKPREVKTPEALAAIAALTRKAVQVCAEAAPPVTVAPLRPKAVHLSDGQLLAKYEGLAKEGNTASAVRAQSLRAKMADAEKQGPS